MVTEVKIFLNVKRLNPYCSGIWSRSHIVVCVGRIKLVLILIVVEYGLGVFIQVDSNDIPNVKS